MSKIGKFNHVCLFDILELISFLFWRSFSPIITVNTTKWTVKLTEICGSLAFWAPSKECSSPCIVFSSLSGHESKAVPPRPMTGLQDRCRAGPSAPVAFPCTLLPRADPPPAAPDSQGRLRHPGMAEVEMIPFGLQTFHSHLSPRSQRRCYLNDLGNECVHQRQKDIVCCLCVCFALWNIFFLIYFKINY